MDYQLVSLTNLNGGAVIDLFEEELRKVLENIGDPNAPAEAPREIRIVIKFRPNKERGNAETTVQATCKLAAPEPHGSFVTFGTDGAKVRAYVTDPHQGELALGGKE